MAESMPARENKIYQNPETCSNSEIEAAWQLVQLSSGDSGTRNVNDEDSSNKDSYSVEQGQGKLQYSKADSVGVGVGGACSVEDVLAEDKDESFGRKTRRNIRYRYIGDLYRVTEPLPKPAMDAKKKIKLKK